MISVYINYPNRHITIHGDRGCPMIRAHRKKAQRSYTVTSESLPGFLTSLKARQIRFAAKPELNDLWLDIELDTPEQEQALVREVQALLGQHYAPLATAPIRTHCP